MVKHITSTMRPKVTRYSVNVRALYDSQTNQKTSLDAFHQLRYNKNTTEKLVFSVITFKNPGP